MRQQNLTDEGFERYRKPRGMKQFLDERDTLIPRHDLCKVIKPYSVLSMQR